MVVCRLASVPTAVPRFVHFSWSFPVNWFIQSILYTPQSKSVTFVSAPLLHSHVQLQTFQAAEHSSRLYSLPLLTLHYDHDYPFPFLSSVVLADPCCRRNTIHLVHVMTCILPPSFFLSTPLISSRRLAEPCTIHSCSLRCFSFHPS